MVGASCEFMKLICFYVMLCYVILSFSVMFLEVLIFVIWLFVQAIEEGILLLGHV